MNGELRSARNELALLMDKLTSLDRPSTVEQLTGDLVRLICIVRGLLEALPGGGRV